MSVGTPSRTQQRDLKPMDAKPKRMAFLGLFGQGNLGNECTLQAIIYNTRRYFPDAEFSCICSRPREAKVTHNVSTFPIRGLPYKVWSDRDTPALRLLRRAFIGIPMRLVYLVRAFKMLMESDALIVPGTGILTDAYTDSFGWPYDIFKWSIIGKLCGCKLFFVSVGVGPVFNPLSRWLIKIALSLADYRSYRDSYSKQYLDGIGFESKNDPVYPDLAFSLPGTMLSDFCNRDAQRTVIGVGVKDHYGKRGLRQAEREAIYRNFIDRLGRFVIWLVEHKYTVRLLIGDLRYDTRAKQDLVDLLRERQLKYDYGQIIDEPILTVEQLLLQLAATEVVVAARFHNTLLAMVLNKPVISLSFHEKCLSLMEEMELAEYSLDINTFGVDSLVERFIGLESNTVKLKAHIEQKTEEYRRALDEQYGIIFNDL